MLGVTLSIDQIRDFRQKIYGYYQLHGRDLPWRKTENPYHIVVSEIMLQQTQVERVTGKYIEFIQIFPNFNVLAKASLKDVLAVWQGLGYNRRALMLKQLAEEVVRNFRGELPKDFEKLKSLPGIGHATAGEILAFAFNMPISFIETNIRRVFIHEFFDGVENVKDAIILPLVDATLDRQNPRTWYWALMDYGSALIKRGVNPNRRSAHYSRQPTFADSDRRIRGLLVRSLLRRTDATEEELEKEIEVPRGRLKEILPRMVREGIIAEKKGRYSIPGTCVAPFTS